MTALGGAKESAERKKLCAARLDGCAGASATRGQELATAAQIRHRRLRARGKEPDGAAAAGTPFLDKKNAWRLWALERRVRWTTPQHEPAGGGATTKSWYQ